MSFRPFVALALSVFALVVSSPVSAAEYGFKDLLKDPGVPRIGAAAPDVVIVMYGDYNCGFCKRMEPVLADAVKTDGKLAVIHKDWPIFGDVSEHAARVALTAAYQGRYEAVHRAFMLSPMRLSDKAMIDTVAKQTGVDWLRLTRDLKTHAADIDAILARNEREALLLRFQGTPGLVINGYVIRGALSGDELKDVLQKVRAAKPQGA